MKKSKLKISAACAAACAALIAAAVPCAAISASACKGVPYDEGVYSCDAALVGGKSDLCLQKQKLIFDVSDFPASGCEELYKSGVTAEYTFYNPTAAAVKNTLAVASGELPYYFTSEEGFAPKVYTDGVEVEAQIRHTYGYYHYATDDIAISDEYVSGDFLKPELSVAVYEVKIKGSVDSDYTYQCVADTDDVDAEKTRFISNGYYRLTAYNNEDSNKICVLGEDVALDLKWTVTKYGYGSNTQVNNGVELTKVEDTTLSELLLSYRKEDSKVSEVDWFNGLVGDFEENKITWHYGNLRYTDERDFTEWYVYDLEVQPKATVVNKVTTPLFPDINHNYTPYVYNYRYDFISASQWAEYGELEIIVKTDYYMQYLPTGFQECVGGYKATYLTKPNDYLNFELSSSSNPSYENTGGSFPFVLLVVPLVFGCLLLIAGGIAGIVVAIVIGVKKS